VAVRFIVSRNTAA